jgi:hypothetical protein
MDIKLSFRDNGGLRFIGEFTYNQMIPIPSVGDTLQVGPQSVRVIERAFVYADPKGPRLPNSPDIEVRFLCEKP